VTPEQHKKAPNCDIPATSQADARKNQGTTTMRPPPNAQQTIDFGAVVTAGRGL
jgi:hypothetical protein